jgi:hypothetical protein
MSAIAKAVMHKFYRQAAGAPELELLDTEVEHFDVPLPFGPKWRGIGYWFRRRGSRA